MRPPRGRAEPRADRSTEPLDHAPLVDEVSLPAGPPAHHLRPGRAPVLTWALLAVLMIATAGALWHLGRGTTFFYDEWDFVTRRRAWALDSVLQAHNGHLNLASAMLFKGLFAFVGLRHYGVFRAMVIVSHLVCCGALFAYARRRVGDVAALAGASLLLVAGRAWEDLLWPFQTALILSVAAGIVTLHLLDRRTTRGDALA